MSNTIEPRAKSWRHTLLGALTFLAVALPAGADPVFTYSTYIGGSLNESGVAVAARGGNTFIAGTTFSLDYPVIRVSSQKPNDSSIPDVFVTKIGPSGTPFYSTYVPTTPDRKFVFGIGASPDGGAYVGALTFYGADTLVDVVKLTGSGAIAWGREIGGRTYAEALTVDSQGNVYITGRDNNEGSNGYVDMAFVWKILPDGTTGYWAEIDGNNYESGYDVAVNDAGYAYVTGMTLSTNLPNALQAVPGSYNAFLTELDPSGAILWSTYLGGSKQDWGKKIALAADGTVVVAGTTQSSDFPTLNAVQTDLRGTQDLFVARFQPWGSRISSTYLGGSGTDEIKDLALDASSILLAVDSQGTDSPLRAPLPPSCSTTFVAKLDAAAARVLDASCGGNAVAADSSGVSVTGGASSGLPVVNAWQPAPAGGSDAFVQKLVFNHPPDCSAAVASPGTLWPADGRFVPVSISGITDLEGDAVTISLTSIFQDEWYISSGTPDASGLGTATASLRASRLNGGNGRVYHLSFTATDTHGAACTGAVTVCVPPAQGGTCIDGGPRVDSTRTF
jgi:Beta-propeller repeat